MDGGTGDDTLNGGAGDDTLTGGDGDDIFQIRGAYGIETIIDFAAGDRLLIGHDINGLGLQTQADVMARAQLLEDGAWIDLGGGNAVHILGLDAAGLSDLIDYGLGFI